MKKLILISIFAMLTSIAFSQTTSYFYDSLGRNDSIHFADGSARKIIFDAVGNPIKIIEYSICDSYAKPVITGITSICQGDSVQLTCSQALQYLWNTGDTTQAIWVKQGGKYAVKVTYPNDCEKASDSIIITIKLPSIYSQNISICRGDSINVYGNIHKANGTYRDSLKYSAANGCDTVVITNLTIKEPSFDTINITICSNQIPYNWNSNNYTTSGIFFYNTTNAVGCDSTTILNLTILSNSIKTVDTSICSSGLPFVFADTSFNESGNYTLHKTNTVGCDSIINLSLTVLQTTNSIKDTTLCQSALPFIWNGLLFSKADSQTAHLVNSKNCDSAATLNVVVLQNSISTIDTVICRNKLPLLWNGITCDTAGLYTYHSNNALGCDSIVTLHLTIKDTSTSITIKNICSNQLPYLWNGISCNAAGMYIFTSTNAIGCDSVAKLQLTIYDTSASIIDTTICNSALPFLWNNYNYNSTGKYTIHFTNTAGCDSAVTLNLMVNDTSISNDTARVCRNSLPYYWNNKGYESTGSYMLHFNNSRGCDSIANLYLVVLDTASSNVSVSVCSNQIPYHWNGNDYFSQGTYIYKTKGVNGCDSIVSLTLTIKQISTSYTNKTICKNQLPYQWNGSNYTVAGTYIFTTQNFAGCDSIATLNLTINDTSISSTSQNVCSNQLPYLWNGITCNNGGVYNFKTNNSIGCDSIAILNLTVKGTSTSTTNISICEGGYYALNGTNYTTAGTYTKNLTNASGCDSTATLILTVKPKTSSTTTATICSGDSISFNNAIYKNSGTYTAHLNNAQSCDSTAIFVLTVLPKVTPAITITTPSTSICVGAVTTFTASITNGGTNPIYQWKKNGVNVGGNSSIYIDSMLSTNDSVSCVLTSNSQCISSSQVTSNKIKIFVYPKPILNPITGISVNCSIGSVTKLSSIYTTTKYEWSSINNSIATVIDNLGSIKAISNGLTYIKLKATTNNNCSDSILKDYRVAKVSVPSITGLNKICVNSMTQYSNLLPNGYWSTNGRMTINTSGAATANSAGTTTVNYKVVNQYNCADSTSLAVTINPLPSMPSIAYAPGTISPQGNGGYCVGKAFTVVGTPSGGIWNSSNPSIITITNTGLVNILKVGIANINYNYTDVNGCTNTRIIVANAVTCAAKGINYAARNNLSFKLYPNPAKNIAILSTSDIFSTGEISIRDATGKLLKKQPLSIGLNEIDISKYSEGIYFVTVITDKGIDSKKLVK